LDPYHDTIRVGEDQGIIPVTIQWYYYTPLCRSIPTTSCGIDACGEVIFMVVDLINRGSLRVTNDEVGVDGEGGVEEETEGFVAGDGVGDGGGGC